MKTSVDMIAGLIQAFAFLTILPMPRTTWEKPGRAYAFFPLVGLFIGFVLVAAASIRFLPADITAFVTLAVWVILTGGLHLDGFGDSCDGLLATTTPERRLEIMKDPRAGSWAIIGLVLLLLGKYVALRHLSPALLILPPVMGRWSMVAAAYHFPYARPSGLGGQFQAGLGRNQFFSATVIMILISIPYGWKGLLAAVAAVLVWRVVGVWAARRLGGGLTGDVYGALCELTELVCLLTLCL
jgi:adenosylcobinamide-GDP ribazoletransferase